MGVPSFPPKFEEWLPADPPAPPIPRWLYSNIRDMIPGAGGVRRLGRPLTEEERARRHEELYGPGAPLPPRGTGLKRIG
ncbi:MAG: hypothetical protein JRE40_08240 [Deltaproteobacteria bacterium]|nr:hypothetical protein [Deltaproteobacteria bacterium]MBW2673230.1 hypothetical protein [Deltaproteobacteria bacterium]